MLEVIPPPQSHLPTFAADFAVAAFLLGSFVWVSFAVLSAVVAFALGCSSGYSLDGCCCFGGTPFLACFRLPSLSHRLIPATVVVAFVVVAVVAAVCFGCGVTFVPGTSLPCAPRPHTTNGRVFGLPPQPTSFYPYTSGCWRCLQSFYVLT